MPVNLSSRFVSTVKIGNKALNKAYSRSYYLLINDGKKYTAYILTIIADSAYVNNDFSKLSHNTYRKQDADFSGLALYYSPKGDYLGGYAYHNGQVVVPTTTQQNGGQKIQSINNEDLKPEKMVQVCKDWYTQVTVYYTDGSSTTSPWEYDGTTCAFIDDGSGGGGGGTGTGGVGGGGSSPSPSTPPPPPCPAGSSSVTPVTPPCIPPTSTIESIGTGKLKVEYMPLPGTSACSVNIPAVPCVEDPCAQAKALATNTPFITGMTDLKSKTALPNEVGYTIDANGIYTYVQGLTGAGSIGLTPATPLSGYIHTHYTGTLPTFSGSDVRAIYQLKQAGKIADITTFTAGVVTASGTSYMMKINDSTKFATFAAANLNTDANFQTFEQYYANKENGYILVGKDITTAYEMALLSALQDSGITLLKGNSNFTSWNTDTISASNGVNDFIVSTNCN